MRHILIADDERNLLSSMQFILEAVGYRVDTVEDGREALDKILDAEGSGDPVDLLITDIQMPRLTGLELVDKLHQLGVDIRILAITRYGDRELIMELERMGCNDYLSKPVDDEELIQRVAMLCH